MLALGDNRSLLGILPILDQGNLNDEAFSIERIDLYHLGYAG